MMKTAGMTLCFAGTTLLCACTVGPDFRAPDAPTDASYTPAPQPTQTVQAGGPGGSAQRFVAVDSVGGAWWKAFGSADLDRLVEEALAASPTLAQARARLAQAQEDYAAQAGTRLPQVDAGADVTRQKINPAALAGGALGGNLKVPPFTLYSGNVNVSYALDLFGANRRALEVLAAKVDYQQYELEAARLAVAGNVATAAIQRASIAAQLELTERIVAAHSEQLDVAERRYRAGGIAEADLVSQRAQVEQSRAAIPPLRRQLAQVDHQLAVYLGRTPAQGSARSPALDDLALPAELPLVLPSTLARNRPDIKASEALLHQASAQVGVATANLYPSLDITGSIGALGTSLEHLQGVWSIGAGLTQPLFHGGTLRARERAAADAYDAALASYRQTVLQGLQQVADALRALEQDAIELDARDKAQRDAHSAARVARMRYEAGGLSLVGLLDAQRTELQAALDRSRIRAQRLSDSAALYAALGARP
jgi:NodT family efflux transporter outer membrane factor (OMF) lipoprotein